MSIALVIGCARSGTSILGELIGCHPDVRYVFEAHRVWELAGQGVGESHRLTAQHATPPVKREIRHWFLEQQGAARLLVEKNPRNVLRVPFLRAVFPEAQLIHIVRDGRDVACSMVPGCGGKEWSHLKPPSWKALMARYEGALRCALAWGDIMEIALADLEGTPHLELRYEELVRAPMDVARKLVAYLGLTEDETMARFCEKIWDATAGSYHAQHQIRWYRDDHDARIGRWRENLTEEERQLINHALAPLLRRLGYE